MGKKKKQKVETTENNVATSTESQDSQVCPVCQAKIPPGNHFYCPACKIEIDYLQYVGIASLPSEKVEEIKKSSQNTWQAYLLAMGVYGTIWILAFYFILRHCLTMFITK